MGKVMRKALALGGECGEGRKKVLASVMGFVSSEIRRAAPVR